MTTKRSNNADCLPHIATRSVHAGEKRVKPLNSLIDPVFLTSSYTFENMAAVVAYQEAHNKGHVDDSYEYGRYGNPTITAAEERIAALEHAETAILVASGMAALAFTFLQYLPSGSHIIITDDSYRRTRQLVEDHLKKFNVTCSVVPLGDFTALEAAIRPETRILFSETPSNPYLRVLDVERFAQIGRSHGLITVLDCTFSTPINLTALDYGIDVVIHSATKYLGGHNDLLAGVIAGSHEVVDYIRGYIGILGGISDPNTAYLLVRGLKTLSLRVQQQNQTTQRMAEFLSTHPAVEQVWYPGLKNHPGHEIAVKQMQGFGGVLSFTVKGGRQESFQFIDALKIPFISASLGGTESLVLHVAAQAYSDLNPAQCLKEGIPQNLVRLAVGIEDADDLIADLDQALRSVSN
ncbi:MAG: aminotransferase class I/II-fold pyridoxal phosphate-dependent enzyme [Chloroflexota bacterium]